MIISFLHLGDKYPNHIVSENIWAKESLNIDLFFGGFGNHFHGVKKILAHEQESLTIINHIGYAAIQLDRFVESFLRTKKKNLLESHTVVIRENTS